MDSYVHQGQSQAQDGQGRDPAEQQQQQQQQQQRYRHVSAPMQQHQLNQNLSSFQESMRQDSLSSSGHGMGNGISMGGPSNRATSSSGNGTAGIHLSHESMQGSGGHVGITIEDNGHHYDHSSSAGYLGQHAPGQQHQEDVSGPSRRADHVIVPTTDHPFQLPPGSSPLHVASFTVPLPPPPGQHHQFSPAQRGTPFAAVQPTNPLGLARVDEGRPGVAAAADHARLDPSSPALASASKTTLSIPTSFSPGVPLHATSPPGPVASFMPGHAFGSATATGAPASVSPNLLGSFSPARYHNMAASLSGIAPSSSSPSRSPVSPVVLQKSSSLRSTNSRTRQLSAPRNDGGIRETGGAAENDQGNSSRQALNLTPTGAGFGSPAGYGSANAATHHQSPPMASGMHTTQLSSAAPSQHPSQQPSDAMSPSSKSSRNSFSGMFHQGYSQYQGQLPGATLSRHLSIQLTPNNMLLPPPPPALHAGPPSAMHSSISMEGVQETGSLQHRDFGIAQQGSPGQHSMLPPYQPQQLTPQIHQQHQQQMGNSSQGVTVPPPSIKYMRSPMMPQLSSQAMAHAQAQSQSQYRQQHSSYPYSPPSAQSNHQFPPRTHRRSIQPLTLDQQQPKGGSFRYVRNQADLWPQKGSQKYRSIDAYGHSVSPLRALTELLTRTYSHCNREFKYEPSYNPRRVLTKPSKPMHNEGYDNEDYDYILYVSDILGSEERQRYIILDVLGQGTFGQVVKCQNLKTNAIVAVKVIKNKPAYFNQSMMEVTVLELLNERYDVDDRHHILRLQDTFIHRRHLCLVFELLSVNLYELIKQNQFRGLSMSLVRVFSAQLLDALCVLNEARIIHCDLKPENVLLKNLETPTIKVIDFGSACHEQQTVYTYIQSRFYRSPEVLVGLPYSSSIDIWSVGCIAAELFLGLPLFPGSSEYNQLSRIVEMLGMPPSYMLEIGKTAHEFFEVSHSFGSSAPKKFRLKAMETYSREHGVVEQPSKRYFQATTLPDIINSYPFSKKGMTPKEIEKETTNRRSFINFLQGLLNLNPIERWSPHQAKLHPFITGEPFTGNFVPPMIPKKPTTIENSARLEPTLPGRTSKSRPSSMISSSSASNLSGKTVNAATSQAFNPLTDVPAQVSHSVAKVKASTELPKASMSLSALGESMVTSSDSSLGSSATDASSLNGSPIVLTPPTDPSIAATAARALGPGLSADAESIASSGLPNSNSLPLSSHSHQRPRATTMGTVGVPKNMAQLAAVMTPNQQGGPSPGGVSGSSGYHRIGLNDSLPLSRLEDSGALEADGHRGSKSGSADLAFGLGQIPERSEQNSPVHDGALTGTMSQPPSQQGQQTQQPRHYLLRSGSDSTGRGLRQGRLSKDNVQPEASSSKPAEREVDDLTPLQRMQQQLQMGQGGRSLQQQQQQSQRYHFGYPQSLGEGSQSGSATSGSVGSSAPGSGSNSNSSSQLELPSAEQEFTASEVPGIAGSFGNRIMFQRMELARSDSDGSGSRSSGSVAMDTFDEDEDEDAEVHRGRFTFDQDASDDEDEEEEEEDGVHVNPVLAVVDYSAEGDDRQSSKSHSGILSGSGTSSSFDSRSYSSSVGASDPRDEDAMLMHEDLSVSASSPGMDEEDTLSSSATAPTLSMSSFVLEEDEEAAPSLHSPPLPALEAEPPNSLEIPSPSLETIQEHGKPKDDDDLQTSLSAETAQFAAQKELMTAGGSVQVLPKVDEADEERPEEDTTVTATIAPLHDSPTETPGQGAVKESKEESDSAVAVMAAGTQEKVATDKDTSASGSLSEALSFPTTLQPLQPVMSDDIDLSPAARTKEKTTVEKGDS